jgi:hypothetical protein
VHVSFSLIVLGVAALVLTVAQLGVRLVEEWIVETWQCAQWCGIDVEHWFLHEIAVNQSDLESPYVLQRLAGILLAWRCQRVLPRLAPRE